MPPIKIHSSSPINAAQASGVTPETKGNNGRDQASQRQQAQPPTATTSNPYAAAQPGAAPSLPVQTGTPGGSYLPPEPTRTQTAGSDGPPPPQPGAVPIAPGATAAATLPPPPKAGETFKPPQTTTMPPQSQMSMNSSYPTAPGQGTATATTYGGPSGGLQPTALGGGGAADNLSHPPGYQQYSQPTSRAENGPLDAGNDDGDSAWNQAKKWAQGVGDNLAAAESEVWKKINKNG